jgi:Tfp pilus assembly protein PilP
MPTLALILVSLALAVTSCSKKQDESLELSLTAPSATPANVAVQQIEKIEETRYSYPYAQKRDPFVPLVGGVQAVQSGSGSGDIGKGELGNLELKGILRDRRGKVALITSTSGEPYTLRSGRIYDKKNRIVNGVSGIIKESSVVLITQNRTVKEIPLVRRESGARQAQTAQRSQ